MGAFSKLLFGVLKALIEVLMMSVKLGKSPRLHQGNPIPEDPPRKPAKFTEHLSLSGG